MIWRLLLPPARVLRLTAYLICVFVALSAVSAGALYAQAKEASILFGRQLEGLGALTQDAETVLLNGARLHYSRVLTHYSVSDALDSIEAHCSKNPGAFASILNEAEAHYPEALEQQVAKDNPLRRGIIRSETEDDGMVVCFVSTEASSVTAFAEAANRFVQTSDLSEFGYVRYVYAKRINEKQSRVVTLWTNSRLRLSRMFPGTGDADGQDPRMVPRPPKSRRTLSAAVEGRPYAAFIFESAESLPEVRSFYDARAKRKGWTSAERDEGFGYLTPAGNQVILALYAQKGRTYVTIAEAGRAGESSIAAVEGTVESVE